MIVIVEHTVTGKRYVLLGADYGRLPAAAPANPLEERREADWHTLSVCDADGEILWLPSDRLRVVTVDGRPPAQHLSDDEAPAV